MKRHSFYLIRVTFKLKTIKKEITKQFILKFQAKKYVKYYLSINNVKAFAFQWLVKQIIKTFSRQIFQTLNTELIFKKIMNKIPQVVMIAEKH